MARLADGRVRLVSTNSKALAIGAVVGLASVASVIASADLRLVEAVKNQDLNATRALLADDVGVNVKQGDGASALHWAAHWGDPETVDALIKAGANVDAQTDLGVTPLYLASEIGSAAVAQTLLAAGADPNAAAETGVSPLMLAARAGAVDAVSVLLSQGANTDATEQSSGQTALMWAVAQGHADVVRVMGEFGADVHARSHTHRRLVNNGGIGDGDARFVAWIETGGSTALLFAARHGDIGCARTLLDFGANVNDTAADGNSALVVAAHSGHGSLAAFLLERGAHPNANGAGYTVLHAAVLRGDRELVNASLAQGAHPNLQLANGTPFRRSGPDYFFPASLIGSTPFLLAANYGSVDMMRVLADAGANRQLTTTDGTTPLMMAADADRRRQAVLAYSRPQLNVAGETEGVEAVNLLLGWGAKVNAANETGNTALHIAASGQSSRIVEVLAKSGAALDVENGRGQTPLALARGRRRGTAAGSPTADLLRKLGAQE